MNLWRPVVEFLGAIVGVDPDDYPKGDEDALRDYARQLDAIASDLRTTVAGGCGSGATAVEAAWKSEAGRALAAQIRNYATNADAGGVEAIALAAADLAQYLRDQADTIVRTKVMIWAQVAIGVLMFAIPAGKAISLGMRAAFRQALKKFIQNRARGLMKEAVTELAARAQKALAMAPVKLFRGMVLGGVGAGVYGLAPNTVAQAYGELTNQTGRRTPDGGHAEGWDWDETKKYAEITAVATPIAMVAGVSMAKLGGVVTSNVGALNGTIPRFIGRRVAGAVTMGVSMPAADRIVTQRPVSFDEVWRSAVMGAAVPGGGSHSPSAASHGDPVEVAQVRDRSTIGGGDPPPNDSPPVTVEPGAHVNPGTADASAAQLTGNDVLQTGSGNANAHNVSGAETRTEQGAGVGVDAAQPAGISTPDASGRAAARGVTGDGGTPAAKATTTEHQSKAATPEKANPPGKAASSDKPPSGPDKPQAPGKQEASGNGQAAEKTDATADPATAGKPNAAEKPTGKPTAADNPTGKPNEADGTTGKPNEADKSAAADQPGATPAAAEKQTVPAGAQQAAKPAHLPDRQPDRLPERQPDAPEAPGQHPDGHTDTSATASHPTRPEPPAKEHWSQTEQHRKEIQSRHEAAETAKRNYEDALKKHKEEKTSQSADETKRAVKEARKELKAARKDANDTQRTLQKYFDRHGELDARARDLQEKAFAAADRLSAARARIEALEKADAPLQDARLLAETHRLSYLTAKLDYALSRLSPTELRKLSEGKLDVLKDDLPKDLTRNEALQLAIHEMIHRTEDGWGYALNWTQIQAELALRDDLLVHMMTGEGKTAVAAVALGMVAAERPVHFMTSNRTLSAQAYGKFRKVLEPLGYNVIQVDPAVRYGRLRGRTVYVGDVAAFGWSMGRGHRVPGKDVIVDEVDAVAVELATQVYTHSSGAAGKASAATEAQVMLANRALTSQKFDHVDFGLARDGTPLDGVGPKLTAEGRARYADLIGVEPTSREFASHVTRLENAAKARWVLREGRHYIRAVIDGKETILIVSKHSGEPLLDRETLLEQRWTDVAQALEAQHGLEVRADPSHNRAVTTQRLLDSYDRVSGMSGTAKEAGQAIRDLYGADKAGRVVEIEPYRERKLEYRSPQHFATVEEKYQAIVDQAITDMAGSGDISTGRPQAIVTEHNDEVALVARLVEQRLAERGLSLGKEIQLVNAEMMAQAIAGHSFDAKMDAIWKQAGEPGTITIGNKVLGRGVDIELHPDAFGYRDHPAGADRVFRVDGKEAISGGLAVRVGFHDTESPRGTIQALNRAGRQGAPGEASLYASHQDELFRRHGDALEAAVAYHDAPATAAHQQALRAYTDAAIAHAKAVGHGEGGRTAQALKAAGEAVRRAEQALAVSNYSDAVEASQLAAQRANLANLGVTHTSVPQTGRPDPSDADNPTTSKPAPDRAATDRAATDRAATDRAATDRAASGRPLTTVQRIGAPELDGDRWMAPGARNALAGMVRGGEHPQLPGGPTHEPPYQPLSQGQQNKVDAIVSAITADEPGRREGLRPLLDSPGLRRLDPGSRLREIESWRDLSYPDIVSKAIEFGVEITGPAAPGVVQDPAVMLAQVTDLGSQTLPAALSSAGKAGRLATEAPNSGAFLITGPAGEPWVIKLYPETPNNTERAKAELTGLYGAYLTGFGPVPYGLVRIEVDDHPYVGVAMSPVPGGLIEAEEHDADANAHREAAHWRSRVSFRTVHQLDLYAQLLLKAGYSIRRDLEYFVDDDGNFLPIDLAGVEPLPDDPFYRDFWIGRQREVLADRRGPLVQAAVENAARSGAPAAEKLGGNDLGAPDADSLGAPSVQRPADAGTVAEALDRVPSFQRLPVDEQQRLIAVVESVTGNHKVLLDGLRPLLASPAFQALDPEELEAELNGWEHLEYQDVFGKGVTFDIAVPGSPQLPASMKQPSSSWEEATDLGVLPASLQRLSSAGEAGAVARLANHSGAYLIRRPDGSEWVVKLWPDSDADGGRYRAAAVDDNVGLHAAAATGYGPAPYGLVRASIAGRAYVGVAMAPVPGGFVKSRSGDRAAVAEAARWRAAVTFDTVRQLDQYLRRLLDLGYHVRTDLQNFVDGEGNFRPIDFQLVSMLSSDPELRRAAVAGNGLGSSFFNRRVRQELLSAAIDNAIRAADPGRARRQTASAGRAGMTVDAVQAAVADVRRRMRLPSGVPVTIVVGATNEALTRDHGIEPAIGPRPAFFRLENGTGVVYLSAHDHLSADDVSASVWHEVVGHFGWRLFGPETRSEILTAVHELRDLAPEISAEVDELYGDLSPDARDEEFLAMLAEEGVPSRLRQAWNTVLSTRLGEALVKVGAISNETLEQARRRHDLEPLYKILRTLVQGIRRNRPVHGTYAETRARLGRTEPDLQAAITNQLDSTDFDAGLAAAVRSSGSVLQTLIDVRGEEPFEVTRPTLEGARVDRQLEAAELRLDRAMTDWNATRATGDVSPTVESALDEAADLLVQRRAEAGRQRARDAVLATVHQIEAVVTNAAAVHAAEEQLSAAQRRIESARVVSPPLRWRLGRAQAGLRLARAVHREAFVVLTREDGSTRRVVIRNDNGRPHYVDVDRSAILHEADVVAVEALVLEPDGTPVSFAGRPAGAHNEDGVDTPVPPSTILELPADQHAAILARIDREHAMRPPADDSLVRFWADSPALADVIENVATIEPIGPGWLRVTTRGGLGFLAGVRRGPVAHGDVAVDRIGDDGQPGFVITVAEGIDRELADLMLGQRIDTELDADWVEAAAAGHLAVLAAQLEHLDPVRSSLQAATAELVMPSSTTALLDWAAAREALDDVRAALGDPYQPSGLALAAERVHAAAALLTGEVASVLEDLAAAAGQAARELGGPVALRRGYDVPATPAPADVLTATKLRVRERRLNAGPPSDLGVYDRWRLTRRRLARLREAVSAAGLDVGAVNHFGRFHLLDRSGYGEVVELAFEYGTRPGLVSGPPLTVDDGWLDQTLRRPSFQQAVGATLEPSGQPGVVTVRTDGHPPFILAVRLDGDGRPGARPVADVVVPFEADREADPSVHELAGRVLRAIAGRHLAAEQDSSEQGKSGLLNWQALGGDAATAFTLDDLAAVGWLRSYRLRHPEPSWRETRALREFLYQKGLLPGSPDYARKLAELRRYDRELADYVVAHNGTRWTSRLRGIIETRPLGEAGIEPSRAVIPVFDGSDLVRLASWLNEFENGPHSQGLSFEQTDENTLAITIPQVGGTPVVVSVVVAPGAGLAARHGQVVRGADAATYELRTPPGIDRLRGERLTIEGLYAVVAQHLDSTSALPPGAAPVLARFEHQLVTATGWRTFRMLIKDLTEQVAGLRSDGEVPAELDDLLPLALRRVLDRGRGRSQQDVAEQLEQQIDRGESEPSRVPGPGVYLGGMALDKLLIGVGNAALGLVVFHNSSWLGATFAIGYGLAEGCGQGYLMYRGQMAGETLEQAGRSHGGALRAERETAQATALRDEVRDVIRPLLENVVSVPAAEPAQLSAGHRWSVHDQEPWMRQRSQRYHLWSNLPYGVMSTIEPIALVGAGAGQWALAAVFGVSAGLGYLGASFGERRRTRHDVANRLRQGQFDEVRRIHVRRQEEALRARDLQRGVSALIRDAGYPVPQPAAELLARRVADDRLGRPVFDRRPNRGLDLGQVLDVRYPTILLPGAVGTAIGLFVSPVVAAVQAGNAIVNTWVNALVESGYGDLDTHYTDLTSAQLAHQSLVRSRQSDDRLLRGVHDLVRSHLGAGESTGLPGDVIADLVVPEPKAPVMPPFWRKIFPLTALLPGIGEFAAVSTLGSAVAGLTGAEAAAANEVTTGSVNAVLTSVTGTAGHYPLNWFRAGKQAMQGYWRMAEGSIAEGKVKQRALGSVLNDRSGNAAALGHLFSTAGRVADNTPTVARLTTDLLTNPRSRALLTSMTKLDGIEPDPTDPARYRIVVGDESQRVVFAIGDVGDHAPARWDEDAEGETVTVTISRLLVDAVEVLPAIGHELRELGELLAGRAANGPDVYVAGRLPDDGAVPTAHDRGRETQLAVLGWVGDRTSDPKAAVRADLALLDAVTSLGLLPGSQGAAERHALLDPDVADLLRRVASRLDGPRTVAAVPLPSKRLLRIAHNSWESALQGIGAQVGGLGSVVKALLPAQVGLGHHALNITRQLFGFGAAGLTELISQGERMQVMLIPPPEGYRTEDDLKTDEVGWSDAMSDRTLAAWREYLAVYPDQVPDVLHAHDGWMTRAAFDLADALGIPVVLTVHATEIGRRGGVLDTPTSRRIHELEWRTVRRADHVIVNSPKMKEEAIEAFQLPADRITVIPNGTDPSRWKVDRSTVDRAAARTRLKVGPDDTVIYYQGRLAKEKGVQDLIAALPVVQQHRPAAKLRIVGDDAGEFAAELKQQVSTLVAQGRLRADDVVFLGRIGHAEGLPELVASADVGVIPSRYEPFGVVANELATAGLPLVASDQIGFVEEGNGLGYPAGAVDELVDAILAVLDDPAGALRRAEAARAKALSPMYHWDVIAQQTVDVYRGIDQHQPRTAEEIGEAVFPADNAPARTAGERWYQSAVFYQALVRAYRDGNGDGYGDLRGLIDQLDYLELLGVDCLWLNPIYPSPLKDGGYDVSDYTDVHPNAGTLDDFKELVAAAHRRGIRIIVDFVPNHSSDQHPWFQESRRDPDGPYGDYYVWSDTPERYYTPLHTDPDGTEFVVDPETGERRDIDPESTWLRITSSTGRPLIGPRIIFTDTETSNWTWDPVRGQYFWHRFFSHQPDLNFENPAVQEAILGAQEFWLELGVDGFRVDAVPYLFVREGTNGENLPETHAFVRRMRALADRYDAMVLCEANQPLDDLMAYFGDPAAGGDEFQMAFDFALMPRLYMALASEVAEPIREIVRSRPDLPASAALMTFLDNHDERTTEMVSRAEREYLHGMYDPTHQRKSNDGFVGRLGPLLGNDLAKVKLANALLFALLGSPIIYYGDELGMGDDPTLPDRDAQRTPMPWTPDRNAGFSTAAPYRLSSGDPDPRHLYLPPVSDPVNGFRSINVENQLYDESSLLHWTRELILSYKLHPALALGTFTDLGGSNGHVLAVAREHGDEVVLGIFNFAGSTQSTELDLQAWTTRRPVDILGQQRFRPIDDLPYAVTLEAHGFRWLTLRPEQDEDVAE